MRKSVFAGILALSFAAAQPAAAEDALVTHKTLSPATALELARATLADCQKRGYQISVAVTDRFGVVQVLLRDRFAGSHTVTTAIGKAYTAASFRTNTHDLVTGTEPGSPQAAIRNLPGVVIVGGGRHAPPSRRLGGAGPQGAAAL